MAGKSVDDDSLLAPMMKDLYFKYLKPLTFADQNKKMAQLGLLKIERSHDESFIRSPKMYLLRDRKKQADGRHVTDACYIRGKGTPLKSLKLLPGVKFLNLPHLASAVTRHSTFRAARGGGVYLSQIDKKLAHTINLTQKNVTPIQSIAF